MRLPVPTRLATPRDRVVHDIVGHQKERLQLDAQLTRLERWFWNSTVTRGLC